MKLIPLHLGRFWNSFPTFSRKYGALCIAALLATNVSGGTHTWTGAVNGNWSNAGNWTGGAPAANEASLALVFNPTAANLSNSNDISGLTIQSVSFSAAASPISCSSTGLPVTITAGIAVGANVSATFGMNAYFTSDQAISVQGNLYFTGVVGGAGNLSLTGVQNFGGMNPYTGVTAIAGGSASNVLVLRSNSFTGLTVGGSFGDIICLQTNAVNTSILEFNSLFHPNYSLYCGTLDLNINCYLDFQMNGTSAGSTYSQFTANTAIKLSCSSLFAGLGYNPKVGDQYTIIKNNSGNPVVGNFINGQSSSGGSQVLSEGGFILPQNRSFGEIMRISYLGGAGHDVVLTVVATNSSSGTPQVIVYPVVTNAVVSQIVPITAVINGKGSSSGGPINFYDGTNLFAKGTIAGGTVSLDTYFTTTGTHTVTAVFTNSSVGYTSAPVTITVSPGPTYSAFPSPEWNPDITEASTVLPGPVPAITSGPDGNAWAISQKVWRPGDTIDGKLARITPQGAIAEWVIPGTIVNSTLPLVIGPGTAPANELWLGGPLFVRSALNGTMQAVLGLGPGGVNGFTIGHDGNIWYTESYGTNGVEVDVMGWFTPTNGAFKTFPTPTVNSVASVMATTADGTVWCAENGVQGTAQFGKIHSTNGPVTEVVAPNANYFAAKMRGHFDGTLWMDGIIDSPSPFLFRWETNGALRVFVAHGGFTFTSGDFVPSPDGGVWYTSAGTNGLGRIGHLDVNGVSTEYAIPNTLNINACLALGPDGTLWYGQAGLLRYGMMTPPGVGPAKNATVTTISASPSPPGTSFVTCTATVSSPGGGTPTGYIVFGRGAPLALTNGIATAVLGGNGAFVAAYSGDANYSGSLSEPAFVPSGLAATNVAAVFLNPPVTSGILTATTGTSFAMQTMVGAADFLVSTTPTGTITLMMDGTNTLSTGNLTSGTNIVNVSGFTPGQHYLESFYSGDSHFGPNVSQRVGFLGIAPSLLTASVNLALSASQATNGQIVTLTATVSGAGEPESLVDFLDGTNLIARANLYGGVAVVNYVFPSGTHSITAHYEGDNSFNSSDSAASTETVSGGTVSPPQLLFVLSPGGFVTSWPASATGFVLEESTNLAVSNWTAVGISPTAVNNQFTVTNSINQPAGFFRLRK